MVLRATEGQSVKANFDNFGCFGGARALGIVDLDEYYSSGRFFQVCGLYQDLATARDISEKMSICDHSIYGVTVKPLDKFNVAPDVVIVIANPRNAMRIIQGYSHFYGTKSDYKFVGNQAVCSELTARPYLENDINVSLLCKGPRTCGFLEHEMGVGIAYNKFSKIVEGICMTITPVENNVEKDVLIEKFKEKGIDDVRIIKDRNYGTFFYKRDYPYFSEQQKNRKEQEELFPDIWRDE